MIKIYSAFDQQTIQYNEILKATHEENLAARTVMFKATQEANLLQAKEKRDKGLQERLEWAEQEANELHFTMTHDFMTENPVTEVSMLAPHRVKRYHFKGLNDDQKDTIFHEREQQLVEQELLKKQREEEERLWALQQEHTRRLQVLNDRDMKRKQRSVAESTKETNLIQKEEHRQKWVDPYGQKQ